MENYKNLGFPNIVEQLRNVAKKEISSSKTCQSTVIRFNPLAETDVASSLSNSKRRPLSSLFIQSWCPIAENTDPRKKEVTTLGIPVLKKDHFIPLHFYKRPAFC